MKGIILAGGSGMRLYPLTRVTSKQLLPVYDKPMIYYPLAILMQAGIREILIISTPEDTPRFAELFGTGENLGLTLQYKVQPSPDGLAQAFILGKEFIGNDNVCMILGDNIFYGDIQDNLSRAVENASRNVATVFGYPVSDPQRFGIVEFNAEGKAISIEEKPKRPKSNFAITGLYFYDNRVCELATRIKPSDRGELEITDLNKLYLEMGCLDVITLSDSIMWLDTGTHESLIKASNLVKQQEVATGRKIACIEEIAYKNGWIQQPTVRKLAESMNKNEYGDYLKKLLD